MAEGVLGLGSGQAASLNNDLIDKLKTAERAATVEPIETSIDDITKEGGESEKLAAIVSMANELLETVKPFDLFVSGGITAFETKTANATGSSVVFDAADESSLNTGTTNVFIEQLARRDVYQSTAVAGTIKDADIDLGNITVALAGADNTYTTSYTFDTSGKTYQEIADEINLKSDLTASIEQVGDDSYRLVIKSAESGTSNSLQITADASLGFGVAENHVQAAQNLKAEVNGIDYDVSTNVITVDGGLKITAVEENTVTDGVKEYSTISIQNDSTTVAPALESFVSKYNELLALVDEELYSPDSPIEDKSTLRTVMEGIKAMLFTAYETTDEDGNDKSLSIFNFGFELDKSGLLTLDTEKLNEAMAENPDDLELMFIGVAEKEGIGTQLKTYIDSLDSFDGLLTAYEESMNSRQDSLEEEKEAAIEDLDNKYSQLATQFAAYTTIITQFENSFSGLSLIIDQSTASS